MTKHEIIRQRLYNQQIGHTNFKTPTEIVSWLGAVQSQDYAGGKWTIGLRLANSSDDLIEQAITDRSIVRTWAMRCTLHFVAAADIHWIMKLLLPRLNAQCNTHFERSGLDKEAFKKSRNIFIKALEGGKQLTRKELKELHDKKGIPTDDNRISYLLQRASFDRLICFGEKRGKEFTHVLLDEWAPENIKLNHDEALAAFTLRYFQSHGPATVKDYSWWSGFTATEARKGLEMIKDKLSKVVIEEQTYWFAEQASTTAKTGTYLLQAYDEYMVGYTDRSAMVHDDHIRKVAVANGFRPSIIMDGKAIGTWRRDIEKNKVAIGIEPFLPFTKMQANAVNKACKNYSGFLGLSLE